MARRLYTLQILEHIKANPGASAKEIHQAFPSIDRRSITNRIQALKRSGKIENLGSHGAGGRWYPVDDSVDNYYLHISSELMNELHKLRRTERIEYLAKRLEDIFA